MAALVLFWIWNVLDARTLAEGKRANLIPLILLAAIILYVIALNVTGVRINRLIKRFQDAKTVYVKLLNPDVVTISINGQDQICACKCLYTYVSARLDGKPTEGTIRLSNNFLTIMGQVREQPVPTWKVQPGLEEAGTRQDTLQYHKAGTVVAAIVIVVALMDFASARLRQSFI